MDPCKALENRIQFKEGSPRLTSPSIPFKNIGKAKNVKTTKLSKIKHILS